MGKEKSNSEIFLQDSCYFAFSGIQHVVYYQEIKKCIEHIHESKQYLINANNTNYDMIFVRFCQLFGGDDENHYFFKLNKYFKNEINQYCNNEDLENRLIFEVTNGSPIQESQFHNYVKEIKNYRNKIVIHRFVEKEKFDVHLKGKSYPDSSTVKIMLWNYYRFLIDFAYSIDGRIIALSVCVSDLKKLSSEILNDYKNNIFFLANYYQVNGQD